MWNPGYIGSLTLSNRFIRSATAEFCADNKNGEITSEYFDLYSKLATGGIGLIIQGHLYVLDDGKAHPDMAGISHDFHIDSLQKLTNLVHNRGGLIAAQINHGGKYSIGKKGAYFDLEAEIQMMTEEDIENVISAFIKAALRVKKAGYDALQIHAAHGYLVSQFLSSKINLRNDSWGGNLENRAKLLLSIYIGIRKSVGKKFPVLVKINGSDDPFEGFSVEEATKVAKWLSDEGIDAIEISGMKSTRVFQEKDEGYFVKTAKQIKENIGDTPLISVGGHRTLSKIFQLHNEFADFISLCRPFIREPDLVLKFKNGKEKADCISCSKCINKKGIGIVRCKNI